MTEITMVAVGDVVPEEGRLDGVAAVLNAADITFGQLEEPLSNRGKQQLFAGIGGPRYDGSTRMDTKQKAHLLRDAGFDVMSFAGNHTMDRSDEGLLDTLSAVREAGIKVVGSGSNATAAHTPEIISVGDVKVGFLAYCSVLPYGYQATPARAGVAPLRARTFYEQIDWRPGTKPKIHSQPFAEDIAQLEKDIAALRPKVDILVVSVHWGIHFEPATVAEYQRTIGRTVIDAGADILLGHHAHILKGVDVYKGKAIIYSLNNFSLRPRGDDGEWLSEANTPSDQMFSVMARLSIIDGKIARLAFAPLVVSGGSIPTFLTADEPYFDYTWTYLNAITAQAGLSGSYALEGNEFVLEGAYDRVDVAA